MNTLFEFYDQAALLERLSGGLKGRIQDVVFLVGSPMSASPTPLGRGVPDVGGVIQLIREEFCSQPGQIAALDQALSDTNSSHYQAAFSFLLGRRGQRAVNEVVRKAVVRARSVPEGSSAFLTSDEICQYLDADILGWELTPGAGALGTLIADYPEKFGRVVLTSNFDPLIQVSVQRAGGTYYRTNLHADGNISNTHGMGCHVIHFHGYWYGSDTLHTPRQLGQPRPKLHDSLASLLRNSLVVVCAYSGWDDSFTEALMRVVRDDTAYPEVLWTFFDTTPSLTDPLAGRLAPGIDRGRVSLYSGVDCNVFLPELLATWHKEVPVVRPIPSQPYQRLTGHILGQHAEPTTAPGSGPSVLEGDDEDRPPHVDICVGRSPELAAIRSSTARAIFVTGIGGQGKSTVAAQYFADAQLISTEYSLFVWRDCKEESERFENQLASIVEKLSGGRVSGVDLAKQDVFSIVELVVKFIRFRKVLLVFDNVDHYVDLESKRMGRSVNVFIEALLSTDIQSRAVFTCRPPVYYDHPLAFSCHLEGIDFDATTKLFEKRRAQCTEIDIRKAHELTSGHAFWLDLLAAQVVRANQPTSLAQLLTQLAVGDGVAPDSTLSAVWATLNERDRTVLQSMAETVKPETELQIADYVRGHLNFSKTATAIRALKALNLIVVKPRHDEDDLLELHPIVRHFVRKTCVYAERLSFIDAIRDVYRKWIVQFRPSLKRRPTLSMLQHWTQNAELDLQAGNIVEALKTLSEVAGAFSESAYPREFCRAAQLVFAKINWADDYSEVVALDSLVEHYTDTLSYLGEYDAAACVLDGYSARVPNKDAKFIRYCGIRCHVLWVAGKFSEAVKWGREGNELKEASGVDTSFDIAHSLALAERDAGRPEAALPIFLGGRTVADVIDPSELDEKRGGPHYGNTGRCLHLMGQIGPALVCYQKSALIIEKAPQGANIRNQGFIRTWIGELLAARGEFRIAAIFLRAARAKWEQVGPPRVPMILILEKELEVRLDGWRFEEAEVESICLDWIYGRSLRI